MRIKRLILKNFRRFSEKTVDFQEGLNVIYGKNEQGKSTVLIALLTVLYFDANTKSSKLLDKISPWGGNTSPFIRLEYSNEGEDFVLEKDFQNSSQVLKELNSGKILANDFAGISALIKEHTGIGSEQVFILTSLIAQNDIARVGNSKEKQPIKSLREAIDSSLLGSARVETGSVLAELTKEIGDLDRGIDRPVKYPGTIKGLSDRFQELQAKASEIREAVSKVSTSTKEKGGSEEDLKKVEEEILKLESLFKNDEIREKSYKRLKELDGLISESEKRIREIERLDAKLELIKKERADIKVDVNIKDVENRLLELKTLTKDKIDEKKMIEIQLQEKKESILNLQSRNKRLAKNAILILTVVTLIAFVITQFNLIPLFIGVVIGIGIYSYFGKFFGEDLFSSQVGLEDKIEALSDSISHLEREKEMLFEKLNISTESELMSLNSRINLLDSEVAGYEAGLKALSGTSDISSLKEEQVGYLSEKKDIEQNKLTDEVVASRIDPMQKFSQSRRLEELKLQQSQLKESLMKAKVEKESSRFTSDDLNLVEEEIYDVRKQLDYYKKKSKILKLVQENIEKARVEVLKQSGSIISEYAKDYLPQLTDGKYSEVKITPDFQFMVFSKEKNDWLVPDVYLSQGTIDQIYFVIRLAILSVICKDASPPLIVDDAFVTFDEARLQGVKDVLQKVSSKYQVVMLTCHKDYNPWGNLINL